jgi:ABC-type transporter Mla subunit MlaD
MDKNIESILATVNFIKDRMLTKDEGATKDDLQQLERHLGARFDALEPRVGNIETELRDIRQRLEALDEAAGNASGFAKEIDHLLKRLATSKPNPYPEPPVGHFARVSVCKFARRRVKGAR